MKTPKKNALEWTVFGVSVAIIIATVAVLVVSELKPGERPPSLQIELGTPSPAGDRFRVPVRVQNSGEDTAEEARIEILLESDDGVVERAELSFAFVPRNSSREGWVVFSRDPRCCTIKARPVGYTKP